MVTLVISYKEQIKWILCFPILWTYILTKKQTIQRNWIEIGLMLALHVLIKRSNFFRAVSFKLFIYVPISVYIEMVFAAKQIFITLWSIYDSHSYKYHQSSIVWILHIFKVRFNSNRNWKPKGNIILLLIRQCKVFLHMLMPKTKHFLCKANKKKEKTLTNGKLTQGKNQMSLCRIAKRYKVFNLNHLQFGWPLMANI